MCLVTVKSTTSLAQVSDLTRGWRHFRHADLLAAIRHIADESDNRIAIRESIEIVRSMHTNFYEVDLDRTAVELGFIRAETLLQTFWQLLPEPYTGGLTFAQWLAEPS